MAWYYWILVGYFFIGTALGIVGNIRIRDWDWLYLLFCALLWLPGLVILGYQSVRNQLEGGVR